MQKLTEDKTGEALFGIYVMIYACVLKKGVQKMSLALLIAIVILIIVFVLYMMLI